MMPYSLPEGWSIKAIGDPAVAIINPPEKLPKADAYPFIPMDAVADGFGGVKYIETIKEASGGYTRFRDGDILLAKITPCVENGKVARISGLNGALGLGSTEFHAIRPAENTDGDYLYYLMSSGAVHGLAVSLMEGTTGRQRIPASIFKRRLAVPMPSDKQEQRRIAAVLSKVDETIAETQASIAAAQKLKRALMQNLLTGKLKPDGTWRRDDEFEIDPKFGRVPKGWGMMRIKDKFNIGRGRVINHDDMAAAPGPYPVYSSQTTNNGIIGTTNIFEFEGEYITWTTDGANAGKVFYRNGRFCCTNVCGTLKGKANLSHAFFALAIDRVAMGHVAVVGNNKLMNNVMGNIRVLAPQNADEQAAIADLIYSIDRIVNQKNGVLERKSRLKKALMQNLLTGKVRVPPDLKIE